MESNNLLKRIKFILLYGILSSLIIFLISLLLSKLFGTEIYSFISGVGIICTFIGAITLGHGNPTPSIGTSNTSQGSSNYANYLNMEVTRAEREFTDYNKSTKNHPIFYFRKGGINLLFNGVIMIIVSIIISKIF